MPFDARARMRALSRWMELRTFGLSPDLVSPQDGLRAGVVVGAVLIVLLATGRSETGWAIFAAFWTCLADSGGARPVRARLLGLFVLPGTVVAWTASWLAGMGAEPGAVTGGAPMGLLAPILTGPVLAALCMLLPTVVRGSGLVATLLAVVAVVAAGYPHDGAGALVVAGAFLAGGGWAWLVLVMLWPGDCAAPARRTLSGVFARLGDLANDLSSHAGGDSAHHRAMSPAQLAEHRRAVRSAVERAKALLAGLDAGVTGAAPHAAHRYEVAVLAFAEAVFHALLALDHLRTQALRTGQAVHLPRAPLHDLGVLLDRIRARTLTGDRVLFEGADLARIDALARWRGNAASNGTNASCASGDAALRAAGGALLALSGYRQDACTSTASCSEAVLQNEARVGLVPLREGALSALRVMLGVAAVTLVAHVLALTYPYWAAMAVVVVLQPVRQSSVSRGIERIAGSVAGGLLAAGILPWVGSPLVFALIVVLGAGVTIAVRAVNYTLFVACLSVLFVLVMNTLHPLEGLAGVRIFDNVLGSLVAIAAALVLIPRGDQQTASLVRAAIGANRAYLDAIGTGDAMQVEQARRHAGLASSKAEIAAHAPARLFGLRMSAQEAADLAEGRRLAGLAALRWHENATQAH